MKSDLVDQTCDPLKWLQNATQYYDYLTAVLAILPLTPDQIRAFVHNAGAFYSSILAYVTLKQDNTYTTMAGMH